MKRKNSILIIYIAVGMACIAVGLSSFYLFSIENKPKVEEKEKTSKKKKQVRKKEETTPYNSPVAGLVNAYNNPDIVAELNIPSASFTTPVAKGADNDYYLQHNFNKEASKLGAIFIDYRTVDIDDAQQINIYGHNSDYYTLPFKVLENYQNEEFFKNNTDVYLNTTIQSLHYKVFAVKIFTSEDEHMIIYLDNPQEYLNHVYNMRSNALYDTHEIIKASDKLLILQTCLYNPEGRKILIMAKLEKK